MGVKLKNSTGSVKTEGVGVNRVNRCCRGRLGVEREETLGDVWEELAGLSAPLSYQGAVGGFLRPDDPPAFAQQEMCSVCGGLHAVPARAFSFGTLQLLDCCCLTCCKDSVKRWQLWRLTSFSQFHFLYILTVGP